MVFNALTANRAFELLLRDEPVEVDQPVEPTWAEDFLEAIRHHRDTVPGHEAENSATLMGRKLAADPQRWFWELWQNADDAGAAEFCIIG